MKDSISCVAQADGPVTAGEEGAQGAAKGESDLAACSRAALAAAARGGSLGELPPDSSEPSDSIDGSEGDR